MKWIHLASACSARPSGVEVPASPVPSNPEYGFALGWPTENANAPRDGCVSAAKTCQLTTYVPTSADASEADRTAPSSPTRPATCEPDGLKTLIPAPAGVTCSLKTRVIAAGAAWSKEPGAGSDWSSRAWADAAWGISAMAKFGAPKTRRASCTVGGTVATQSRP